MFHLFAKLDIKHSWHISYFLIVNSDFGFILEINVDCELFLRVDFHVDRRGRSEKRARIERGRAARTRSGKSDSRHFLAHCSLLVYVATFYPRTHTAIHNWKEVAVQNKTDMVVSSVVQVLLHLAILVRVSTDISTQVRGCHAATVTQLQLSRALTVTQSLPRPFSLNSVARDLTMTLTLFVRTGYAVRGYS